MGSGRHLCCGGRWYTYADANCYSDAERHPDSQPHCNRYAATYSDTEIGAISKAAPDASAETLNFPSYREPELPGHRIRTEGRPGSLIQVQ